MKRFAAISALMLCLGTFCGTPAAYADEPQQVYVDPKSLTPIPEEEYFEEIEASSITRRRYKSNRIKKFGRDWREKYRLVYNFNRVYPFALVGRQLMAQVDSTISADSLSRGVRARYINDVEKELFRLYEKEIWKTTISQGVLLMRLIDRECGVPAYDIISTYEGNLSAGFWQLVAKFFEQDLKSQYDPDGKDADTERLIKIWEDGDWDEFYWGIFGTDPPRTNIVSDRLSSTPHQKRGTGSRP